MNRALSSVGYNYTLFISALPTACPISEARHDHVAADRVAASIGFGHIRSSTVVQFQDGLTPEKRKLAIGAYPNAFIMCGNRLAGAVVEQPPWLISASRLFKGHDSALIESSSGTGSFALAFYSGGALARRIVTDGSGFFSTVEGVPMEAETSVNAAFASLRAPGMHPKCSESTERVGFRCFGLFFGDDLDRFDGEKLIVEKFDPAAQFSILRRLVDFARGRGGTALRACVQSRLSMRWIMAQRRVARELRGFCS